MPKGRRVAVCTLAGMLGLTLLIPTTARGSGIRAVTGGPEVIQEVHHDISPPLASMSSGGAAASRASQHEHPARPLPTGTQSGAPDGALQASAGPSVATTPGLTFAGVGNGDYGFVPNAAPPDPNLSVGATQVVQWVNESFAVFDKATGALVHGPFAGNTLWAGFGGGCETNNDGDPIAKYDQFAGRWILTQFSVSTSPFLECVAVSTTSDATGTYNLYSFPFGTEFNDYPKLGVWPDAYYMTFNIFNNGSTFAGSKLCALDRSAMIAGGAATMQCFQLSTSFGGVLPSDLDGATAPPTGSPNYMLNFGSNSLNEWKFHVDFGTPANSTLTGPLNIPVAAFTSACKGGGACIAQPSTRTTLDSLGDRLMYRLAYRNTGAGEVLVVDHSVNASGKGKHVVLGVRWYELHNPNAAGGASVFQQGTYSPDSTSRWMGSIAMDKNGDIAVGYSASSSTVFPSIRYTGRQSTDTLGTLQAENTIMSGGGSQINLSRWGDYTSMAIDPGDDCTFFYTNEYLKATGSFNWSTWIASFKFTGCV